MTDYPKFSINGVELDSRQNATVWVALQSFGMQMQDDPTNMGNDEHGLRMAKLYLARVQEINDIAIATTP